MRVSCRHWSAKIGAVFFYSRKEDKDGEKRQEDTLRGSHTGKKKSGFVR